MSKLKNKEAAELFVKLQQAFFQHPENNVEYVCSDVQDDRITVTLKISAEYDWSKLSKKLKERLAGTVPEGKERCALGQVRIKVGHDGNVVVINTSDMEFTIDPRFDLFNAADTKILGILSERMLDYLRLKQFACEMFGLVICDAQMRIVPKDVLDLRVLVNSGNIYLGDIDVSNLDDLTYAFAIYNNKNVQENRRKDFDGIEKWNTSKVKKMLGVFAGCVNFDKDISMWDTSSVTVTDVMFASCKKFNQDVSAFNMSNVESMKGMFYRCESFNQDISGWDTSKVKDMSYCFYKAKSFDQDISSWSTESCKTDENMFLECRLHADKHPKLPSEDFKMQYYKKYVVPKTKRERNIEWRRKLSLILCFIICVFVFMMFNQPQP